MTADIRNAVTVLIVGDGPHNLRFRGNRRKGYVYRAGSRAEVRVPRGTDPADHLRAIVDYLLGAGFEIGDVDGKDADAVERGDGIDWGGE